MKTLIISSSLSKESKSFILCQEIEKRLKKIEIQTELFDLRNIDLTPTHISNSKGMKLLIEEIKNCDNIIIGMGVHSYSINDSLKIILDNCFEGAKNKFFGILCAAGSEKSYLSTFHLTQICMSNFGMIQLPKIVFATNKDFNKNNKIINKEILERLDLFLKDFLLIGNKLL